MTVKKITTEFGHTLPPVGPHNITVHGAGWDVGLALRDGDMSLLQKMKSIYPRFTPFGAARQLSMAIHQKLSFPPTHGCLPFVNPDIFSMAQEFAFSHHRKEHKLEPSDLLFKVVDISGVRLYCIGYPMPKTPGIIGVWQNPGTGVSSRLAEHLLKQADTLVEVPASASADAEITLDKLPAPTYLPESAAHQGLRDRIAGLMNRAPVASHKANVKSEDVYLYPTGMAAVHRLHQAIMQTRRGTVVGLGAIFHNTYHLFLEFPDGFKHFGQCNAQSGIIGEVEAHIKAEAEAGRKVSYVFVEFPSNPILVSVDLKGLRQLADKHGFLLVVDDTVGSFCNIDLLPVADVVLTSLTKSFSGYANVMGGSVVLNPSSPSYPTLSKVFQSTFHNEFFSGDAEQLLANSTDYLTRSTILNRNAAALASLLQSHIRSPAPSAVTQVLYPSHSDTHANYTALMRPATAEFTPGYGCLLSIDFADSAVAREFYDKLQVHQGPHLGAHLTLALNFNDIVWGKPEDEAKYHAGYGLRAAQVRVSVGLEEEAELVEVFEEALKFAEEAVGKN